MRRVRFQATLALSRTSFDFGMNVEVFGIFFARMLSTLRSLCGKVEHFLLYLSSFNCS